MSRTANPDEEIDRIIYDGIAPQAPLTVIEEW